MDSCLSQEMIEQYLRQLCSADVARSVEAHIADCHQCKRRIELVRSRLSGKTNGSGSPGAQTVEAPPVPGSNDVPTLSMPQPSDRHSGDQDRLCDPHITFEGYQLLEELPQGGQAVVYKALHKATKAKVALKVLLPGLPGSVRDKARQYFKQEVELAASLSHPNIVAIRDSGISQGQYYFSMDYIHGQPLDRYVQAKALSIRGEMTLFCKICDAMAHAHQRGVIHRDLKPSNILVDERGEPHVLDFGLAKTAANLSASADGVMPTITGQIKGTVAYMSPEQAAGRSDLVDVRTDVYSLGVVLYQMCTGKLPYDVLGTIVEALRNIQYAEPLRPRRMISGFSKEVEAIILKCLAKDPDQRYGSAGELRKEVQRWLDGLPIDAKSESAIYVIGKIVGKHRYTATVITSLLVILCSSASVSFHFYREERNARRVAEIARIRAEEIAKEKKRIAEGAARFVAELMMRDRQIVGEPSALIDHYGPRQRSVLPQGGAVPNAFSIRRADPNPDPTWPSQDNKVAR